MLRTFGHRGARAVTSFLLEGGLVFLVLYSLAMLTGAFSNGPSAATAGTGSDFSAVVALASLVFAGTLVTTTPRRLHGTVDARRQLLITSLVCFGVGIVAFAACCAWTDAPWFANAGVMLGGAVAVPLVVSAWRWSVIHLGVFEGNRERVLVLGTGETARSVSRWISERCPADFDVVGFAARSRDEIGEMVASGTRVVASFEDMTAMMSPHVDRIIVALEEKRGILPTQALMHLRLSGVVIEDATTFLERTSGKIAVENLLPSWLIFSDGFRVSPTRMFFKRVSDIVLSLALLIVATPVMLLTAAAIWLESRGSVLFRQDRVGRHGREFELIKFRSMVQDAEKKSGPAWATSNDPRVTRVGRIIRKTRIDELPQLINVLRGEMSFVGPRPERHHFVEKLQEEIPYFSLRLAVRPGITGWAQVSYGYGSNVAENREKLKYDLFYIKNVSFFLDFWVVLKTVGVVLRGSGAR